MCQVFYVDIVDYPCQKHHKKSGFNNIFYGLNLCRPHTLRPSARRRDRSGRPDGTCVTEKASDVSRSHRLRDLGRKLFPPHAFRLSIRRSERVWPSLYSIMFLRKFMDDFNDNINVFMTRPRVPSFICLAQNFIESWNFTMISI
jgi:hypothetical protein